MGTPMAVTFANILISKFEEEMLDDFQSIHGLRPALWLRFIDDIFSFGTMMRSLYSLF